MRSATFVIRFFAFLSDLLLALIISAVAHSSGKLTFLGSYGLEQSYITILVLVTSFFILRSFGTLVFGVSIFSYLFGIRSTQGGFFYRRLMGVFRELLGISFLPLIVFTDLGVPFARRSLKEVITATKLKEKSGPFHIVLIFIVTPLLVFSFSLVPFLENSELLDGVQVEVKQTIRQKIDNQSDFSKYAYYSSQYFHFTTISDLDLTRDFVIPSFQVETNGGVKEYVPFLTFYDLPSAEVLNFKKQKIPTLKELLRPALQNNPLLKYHYPAIYSFLQSEVESNTFSDELKKEIEAYLVVSFNLSFFNLLPHIISEGPFIRGHILVRNNFLNLSEIKNNSLIEMNVIGDTLFLSTKVVDDGKLFYKLVPLDHPTPWMIEMVYRDSESGLAFFDVINKKFFANMMWYWGASFPVDKFEKEEQLSPFYMIDFFINNRHLTTEKKVFENYVYHYYYDLCKIALTEDDKKLYDIILASMNRLLLLTTDMNKDKSIISQEFVKFIEMLKLALINRDKSFFN